MKFSDVPRKIKHNLRYYLQFPKRLKSVTRISLEADLTPLIKRIRPGLILDVGSEDAPYRELLRGSHLITMDVVPDYGADVVCDIHAMSIATDSLDSIIATEVLEHCRDPRLAVSEIYRVLRPGGTCIVTTRFICAFHPTPRDYYRFTWDSLEDIFSRFSKAEIIAHGSTLQSVWSLITAAQHWYYLNVFNSIIARIVAKRTMNPCGFLVFGTK
ncbi:MAG: class I SAM-dependent methyltransferase [Gemmatimonadota bacterium]|nr:class I SAM-dependent methyltransferase [Gemmatimonadota bacterium]